MRAVLTRVAFAEVVIDGQITARINRGFLVLLGVGPDDGVDQAKKLALKITGLRVFEDDLGKMNLDLLDVGGSLLVVPNFTLYGSCKKGRRPDFLGAAKPDEANAMFQEFLNQCRLLGYEPQAGEFGAHMLVNSVNDGPVTLILDTDDL